MLIYRYDGIDWNFETKLLSPDAGDFDFFGGDPALSGNTLLVRSRASDRIGYVFEFDGQDWIQVARLTASDAPAGSFAEAVALDRDVAVLGSYSHDNGGIKANGAAYVYVKPPAAG